MALDAHKNFAIGTVLTAPSPATSGTSLVLQAGQGALFPAPPFNATVWPVGNLAITANAEVVRVTNRVSDTLTITRAQESSTARTILVGDQVAATFTAKFVDDLVNASNLASGVLPDACVPSPDLKITSAGTFTRLLLNATGNASGSRACGVANIGGQLYLVPYVDDFSTAVNFALRLDRAGNAFINADVYEKGRPNAIGHWAPIGYSSANFTANVGSWTVDAGDQITYSYTLAGRTIWLSFYLQATSVSGTPTELRIALPSGSTAALATLPQAFAYMDGAVAGTGCAVALAGESFVRLRKDINAIGTWPNATNVAQAGGILAIPIN